MLILLITRADADIAMRAAALRDTAPPAATPFR